MSSGEKRDPRRSNCAIEAYTIIILAYNKDEISIVGHSGLSVLGDDLLGFLLPVVYKCLQVLQLEKKIEINTG